MRKPFIEKMHELAARDPKVILILGDVGFSYIEEYKAKFPNQFLNHGVMEQTMMGTAVGMARMGWKPYVYTMINFIVFRPYEQVRNDIAYGNANVKLFGVAGGPAYKFLGYSHNIKDHAYHNDIDWSAEDEVMFSHLPNINVHIPEEEADVQKIMETEYLRMGPSYMRL